MLDKISRFMEWLTTRPLKFLIILLALETFIFVALLVVLVWILLFG